MRSPTWFVEHKIDDVFILPVYHLLSCWAYHQKLGRATMWVIHTMALIFGTDIRSSQHRTWMERSPRQLSSPQPPSPWETNPWKQKKAERKATLSHVTLLLSFSEVQQ